MEGQHQVTRRTLQRQKPLRMSEMLGNAVVDGVLYGMVASVVMLTFYVILGALAGYPLDRLVAALGMPGIDSTPLQGAMGHLAMGIVYGIAWSVVLVLPIRRMMAETLNWRVVGLVYGVAAWLFVEVVIFAVNGESLLPWFALLLAYLGYGGTLGYLQSREG
jgi:hypothetical protein